MPTPYQVRVEMSPASANALDAAGFILYALRPVKASINAGLPLVWYRTRNYSATTTLRWTERYRAYTSGSPIRNKGRIDVGFQANITPGQLLTVDHPTGTGRVSRGRVADAVSLLDSTTKQFTCGLAVPPRQSFAPLCALPLFGGTLVLIEPLPSLMLMFATEPLAAGAAVKLAYGPAMLIDLGGSRQRRVHYDINGGWSWGGATWGQAIPANASLSKRLIRYSPLLASAVSGLQPLSPVRATASFAGHPRDPSAEACALDIPYAWRLF